jgi:hypothetical protein
MQPEVRMPKLKAAADNVKMKPMKCVAHPSALDRSVIGAFTVENSEILVLFRCFRFERVSLSG